MSTQDFFANAEKYQKLHYQSVIFLPYLDGDKSTVRNESLLTGALNYISFDTFVFLSSGGRIYGESPNPRLESQKPEGIDAYAQTKLLQEKLITENVSGSSDQRAIIVRLTNPYGKLQSSEDRQGFIASLLWAGQSKTPLKIFGDGQQTRDFIHIGDFFEFLMIALELRANGVFNVGYGESRTLLDVVQTYESLSGNQIELEFVDQSAGLRDSKVNISLAKSLGWKPRVSLEEGLLGLTYGRM